MNMVVFPKRQETLSPERLSTPQKTPETTGGVRSVEKKTDFEKTLERVSNDTQQKKSPKESSTPSEKLKKIREDVASLIEHPEMQTKENITQILEELMAFLTQGSTNIPQDKKPEATEVLSSLKELLSQWEKGTLQTQDFLQKLFAWLTNLETTKGVFLQPNDSVNVSSLTSLKEKETKPAHITTEAHIVPEEKSFSPFRVIDKRTPKSDTPQTPTLSQKDTIHREFSSQIETLMKQIDGKEIASTQAQKLFQDSGVKLAPALPSLPRVSVEQMLQQVAGKALITLRNGQSEMRLQLTPPDLGRMEMKIVLEDGQMQGKIVVSTPEAKALFDQNLGELQRQLQQVGIQVGSLDVSLGQSGKGEEESPTFVSKGIASQDNGEVTGVGSEERPSLWKDNRINYVV